MECVERGLDPLTTHLVVADPSRTEKTICLAVSPSLKSYGIPGRPRLFEVIQKVNAVNLRRERNAPRHALSGKSFRETELRENPALALDYIVAPPQMARYMKVSTEIYQIYLRYIAPEDIHVYSIDEVFIDAAPYLKTYRLTPRGIAEMLIRAVLNETGITATAGIGTNLYLAKIAMDIVAKHIPADRDGVRIAELTERSYREKLWSHRPLTDFWRVGRGYAAKLEENGLYTMGDIARCSLGEEHRYHSEELLYRLFGINAELLIDHAWGVEPCTIAEIKAYRPENNSMSTGQVLSRPYDFRSGRLVVREMADLLVYDLVEKGLVCDQIVLTVGYDRVGTEGYAGELHEDRYGRNVPKSAHGSINLGQRTSSTKRILNAVTELYDRIVNPKLCVRRIYVVANHVTDEKSAETAEPVQLDLFTDPAETEREERETRREKEMQKAVVSIKKKYGKNAVLKGMNLEQDATAVERNSQIGGHKA